MALLKLSSTNPEFSFIIAKNPTGLPLIKSIRKGYVIGWYSSNDTYSLWFKDGNDEISFKDYAEQEFEHVSTNKYESSMAYASMIKECFYSAMKTDNPKDGEGFTHTLEINQLRCKNQNYLKIFEKYHDHLTIDSVNIVGKSWNVKMTSTSSISDFLNLVSLFLLFTAVVNDEHIYIDDEMVSRYTNSIKRLDSPYFIRYIFKSRILEGRNIFKKYKEVLESSETNKIALSFGDTQIARKDFVASNIDLKLDLVDIGCGEGSHILYNAKKFIENETEIHAIDRDPEVLSIVKSRCATRNYDNVNFYSSIDEFLDNLDDSRNYQIVLSEVIEHNELSELTPLMEKIRSIPRVQKIIITTPNKDFNVNYAMEDEYRHHDHKWEMNGEEFTETVKSIFGDDWIVDLHQVGDIVNGVSPTSGCVVRLYEKPNFEKHGVLETSNSVPV